MDRQNRRLNQLLNLRYCSLTDINLSYEMFQQKGRAIKQFLQSNKNGWHYDFM